MKYEYVEVVYATLFSATISKHKEIINEYARNGYKYVGYIPTKMDSYGKIKTIVLIFETEE